MSTASARSSYRRLGRFERQPVDAARCRRRPVRLVPDVPGRKLDADRIALSLVTNLPARAHLARFLSAQPKLTTEKAQKLGITELVSEFSTNYPCCAPRVTNIKRAATLLDGTIILPGKVFSLNGALGKRTKAKGFVSAPQIFNGRFEDAVGGGISQVATTLFNAAFFSGIKLVAHQAHQFYISRYPMGREATVSWGGPELIFRNDWPAAILMKLDASDSGITVRFYSTKLGRRVTTTTGKPYDLTTPKTVTVTNSELPAGAREVVQEAGDGGFTVDYTRQVFRAARRSATSATRSSTTPRTRSWRSGRASGCLGSVASLFLNGRHGVRWLTYHPRMAKVIVQHVCSECGTTTGRSLGKCPGCGAFGSLVEELSGQATPAQKRGGVARTPARLSEVRSEEASRISSGVPELDRVLGGGIVPASLVLVGGEPGVGKSTLLLAALGNVSRAGRRALLVTGEESVAQVKLRADRLGGAEKVEILAETELESVCATLEQERPAVCVIDSVQTLYSSELGSAPGSVAQVREAAGRLLRVSKEQGVATILVGHVTKDGSVAGPRVLEHLVDCVLQFEGDRYHAHRILRAVKNRFGSTNELGVFEMTGAGLVGVPDPSELFGRTHSGEVGAAVACALEGTRPILLEIQALVSRTDLAMPRRVATGVDPSGWR